MKRPIPVLALAAIVAASFAALAVAVETNLVAGVDETIRMDLHALASPSLTVLAQGVTWLGTLLVLALVGGVAVAAFFRARRRHDIIFLGVTMIGALALENGLKYSFQRARPPPFFGAEPETYSFPSGHALFSLCLYGALAIAATRSTLSTPVKAGVWIATLALVSAIGATRIYLGVHYPSDVLGGYLVAVAWLCLVLAGERSLAGRRATRPDLLF